MNQLGLAWYFDIDTKRGQEATPLVADGVMYFTTAWSKVAALDAAPGALRWRYDPNVPPAWSVNACCDVVNRGVALWKRKVFLGTLDGRLIALDARTGMGSSDCRSGFAIHDYRCAARGKGESADRQWRCGVWCARIYLGLRRRERKVAMALLDGHCERSVSVNHQTSSSGAKARFRNPKLMSELKLPPPLPNAFGAMQASDSALMYIAITSLPVGRAEFLTVDFACGRFWNLGAKFDGFGGLDAAQSRFAMRKNLGFG